MLEALKKRSCFLCKMIRKNNLSEPTNLSPPPPLCCCLLFLCPPLSVLALSFFPGWSLWHFYKDSNVPHIESVSGLSLSLLPPCPGLILPRVMFWSSSPCPSAKWLQDLSIYHQHASQTSSSPHPIVPPSLVAASSCLPRLLWSSPA